MAATGAIGTASADAATWIVKGRGFGHGVGMSQYGAFGFALEGSDYKSILRHYFRGTTIGETSKTPTVRVLLEIDPGDVYFRGAGGACGRKLNPAGLYRAHRVGSGVRLLASNGKPLADCRSALRAEGAGRPVRIGTLGPYRGALEVVPTRSSPGSLNVINALDVNSYVKGVIADEIPASWPREALRTQAVAARSYALTGKVGGNGFDLYADTRSQVYGGAQSESSTTSQAVADTRNQVVRYQGEVAQTFFSSTSGGQTEGGFLGAPEVPYLRSVKDPYDFHSPLHTWTLRYSNREMNARLDPYVAGGLRDIRVTARGDSPRIDRAQLIGTGGTTTIRGDTLQFALDGYDRWMYFAKRT